MSLPTRTLFAIFSLTVSLIAPAHAEDEWTRGEVRKIDTASNKVTLKHEYIKVIDMPPMTMVFPVANPAQLSALKAGDAVRFVVDVQGGKMLVTKIEALPAGK